MLGRLGERKLVAPACCLMLGRPRIGRHLPETGAVQILNVTDSTGAPPARAAS